MAANWEVSRWARGGKANAAPGYCGSGYSERHECGVGVLNGDYGGASVDEKNPNNILKIKFIKLLPLNSKNIIIFVFFKLGKDSIF